jgi:geranylgeranyl diphosphate synthase type I
VNAAAYAGAAIELYHTWTLVHDDIIDCDDQRRGAPSAHALVRDAAVESYARIDAQTADAFGTNMAILAGDIQQAWANSLILDGVANGIPVDIGLALLRRLNQVVNVGVITGEALDVEMELRSADAVGVAEIEKMLHLKTAVVLRFAAEAGAMIGLRTEDADHPQVIALGKLAADAGIAFQLRDDLLGMFGDEAKLGKPVGSDLRQGKRTVLFAEGLRLAVGADHEQLAAAIGDTAADVGDVQRILRDCGAVAAIEDRAAALVADAQSRLTGLPANNYRDLIAQWLAFLTSRTT